MLGIQVTEHPLFEHVGMVAARHAHMEKTQKVFAFYIALQHGDARHVHLALLGREPHM